MAAVKIKVTYNAAKLVRRLPKILEKLTSDSVDRAKLFYRKNTLKGKDIYDKPFEPLTARTKEMRIKGQGTYKRPISHQRPLIASKKMINSIEKVKKDTLRVSGYGVHHNSPNKAGITREWFGVSENVLENIIDNKKIKTFRKQIARAFKK
tara:strand:+ start:117 stop:569 length:453 start_codon:yes stop_codon:yes gene_type:complete